MASGVLQTKIFEAERLVAVPRILSFSDPLSLEIYCRSRKHKKLVFDKYACLQYTTSRNFILLGFDILQEAMTKKQDQMHIISTKPQQRAIF